MLVEGSLNTDIKYRYKNCDSLTAVDTRVPSRTKSYNRGRQRTACVPNVARGTIFCGTMGELKYNNYYLIKNWIFNSIQAYNSFKAITVFTSRQIENC
jgi:hypothetical protein